MSDAVRSDIGPFAIVPDWIIRASISDRAVRVFALLARYADRETLSAFPKRGTLAAACRCSVDSIDRALHDLVTIGSVTIQQRVDDAGVLTSSLYQLQLTPTSGRGVAAPVRLPSRTPAATRSRTVAARVAAPMRQGTITTGTKPIGSYERDFETRFWPAYPKQVAKKDGLKAYLKLAPDVALLEQMLAALKAQEAAAKDLKFFPHPATWLNGERWLDDSSSTSRPAGRTGAPPAGKYAGISETDPDLERAS